MTFKANWEKAHDQHPLNDTLIKKILKEACPNTPIKHYEIIAGGCANINIKLTLENPKSLTLLRIYLRDKKAAYKEKNLAEKLQDIIPAPKIFKIFKISNYTCALTEFLPGTTLRNLILFSNKKYCESPLKMKEIIFKIGEILAKISSIKFQNSGFFNENLKIFEPIKKENLINFFEKCLNNPKIKSTLSSNQQKNLHFLLKNYGALFPDGSERNLVHGDFCPSNILAQKIDERLKITGILDWEFAFSGSTLCDIANMLRYAHQMPEIYEKSFLEGLNFGGYKLPENWKPKIGMLNLLSLLDCLQRTNIVTHTKQVSEIKELIEHIIISL